MKHGLRVAVAFAVAPLLPSLVFALLMAPTRNFAAYLVGTTIVAYGFAAVLGTPALLWMRHSGFTFLRVLIASFLIGFLPVLVLTAMAPAGRPRAELLFLPGAIGIFSIAGGAIFWLLARPALNRVTETRP